MASFSLRRLFVKFPSSRQVSVAQNLFVQTTRAYSINPPGFHERFPCIEGNAEISTKTSELVDNDAIDLGGNMTEGGDWLFQTFPCITVNPSSGPEPTYQHTVSGFEIYQHDEPFPLKYNNSALDDYHLAYETWGELNADKSNVVLLQTGLSASSHARSHPKNTQPGWWEKFIRPGGPIDLDRFFVVCVNNLGGCYGSSGPSSIDPRTGRPFGTTFPMVSVEDMVRTQFHLLDYLGIDKVYACVGSSLGGMQSLLSAALFADRVERFISISACASAHPSSIALRYLQRKCIMMDPLWRGGHYYDSKYPKMGMKLAREIGTMTYRSGPEWDLRFSRKKLAPDQPVTLCPSFVIENYLDYQGEMFSVKYDPNSLLYISKAMDLFDMSEGYPSMIDSLKRITCPALIIGVKTDILFPVRQQRQIAEWLEATGQSRVTFYELNSLYGHDTFLLDVNGVGTAVKGFLEAPVNE